MEGLGNKEIFSKNLRFYMEKAGKDRNQICAEQCILQRPGRSITNPVADI